ncbi:uncharacterized protein LOC134230586 isoform X1 [Saccostrea cucullata]|uniref:uncharacterized protein LOC134230586 isoform X1 n=2 Tax=Saccostrea cuccullata TaxID=36930 RepID=UPI002ED57523
MLVKSAYPLENMTHTWTGMSTSQFEDSGTSISKLMAGALLMDTACDLPSFWPSEGFPGSTQSSQIVKMEKEGFAPNSIDCWPLPGQQTHADFHHNAGFQHVSQHNGFNPVSNGSINGNNTYGQNYGNSHFKPPQDQFRKRYGNYSNEQYPDTNIALKTETEESKWNNCAINTQPNLFEPIRSGNGKPVSLKEGPYSPPSFKMRDRTPHKLSPNLDSERKLLGDFVESDSDSKTSDSQPTTLPDWTGNSPTSDINVDQMITSGVTVAGYKPRKLICKRKKSTVPSDMKDPSYWEKRKKNNDSARRSREAKKEKERNFYKRALELEYENHYLKERVAFLERKLEAVMKQNSNYPGPETQTVPPPPHNM